jgi:hypothetical protein
VIVLPIPDTTSLFVMAEPDVHVTPIDDLIEHEISEDCPCGPWPDAVRRDDGSVGWVLVHHSLDGREAHE